MKLQKPRRNRGLILTLAGLQKLQDARREFEIQENSGGRYTLEELSERTGLAPRTVAKILAREEGVDKRTIDYFFRAFNLELDTSDYSKPDCNFEELNGVIPITRQDLREAVDVSIFYGRLEELAKLEQWILSDNNRIVAVIGMGGIGKTALAAKLVEQLKNRFEYVIWRSLLRALPVKELLANLIQFLSNQQQTETDLPESVEDRVSRLIDYLRSSRCLLVLDNAETILVPRGRAGHYREGYEGYGELLRRVGESLHQSCLVLTSREKPKEVASLEGETLQVRSFRLSGLKPVEGQEIFKAKGLSGSEDKSAVLIEQYAGNPLALKIVATAIQDVFDGNVAEFLTQNKTVFGDIRDILNQQFNRLSDLEQEIMYWLAIDREPVSLSQLQEDIVSAVLRPKVLEMVESLGRRSLIEKHAGYFTLQPVVMEYVIDQLIEQVCEEIATKDVLDLNARTEAFRLEQSSRQSSQKIIRFNRHALIKAQAKEYIRETQVRLILQPVIDRLHTLFGSKRGIEEQLAQILSLLRAEAPLEPGYASGNILNLLGNLQTDLSSYNFSDLSVWQTDLRKVNLHSVNFQNADLSRSIFAETFGGILSVALSPNGKLVAAGDTNGQIHVWQVADGKQLLTCRGNTSWIVSVAFSPDGGILVSGSTDNTVKVWDASTGQCLSTLLGHSDRVRTVAISPDGHTLASSSDDSTVRLWDWSTGQCLQILRGHRDEVWTVAFSPDGNTLASGSFDSSVKLWDTRSGQDLRTLQGHKGWVYSVAFSPDGDTLASSSADRTVRLWDVSTGECLKTLQGHLNGVWSVAFAPQPGVLASVLRQQNSPDAHILASSSDDQTVKLWDWSTGECLRTLQGHRSWICSVAFSPEGTTLASGSVDRTVKLWDVSSGQCLRTLQGYSDGVWAVAFSPDGHILASSSDEQIVRLWDARSGQYLRTLQRHTGWIWSVAFSPDGQTLASASDDQTIKLWDWSTGECLRTLQGHRNGVWAIAFSPEGTILASGSTDRTIKLWDASSGECLKTLQDPASRLWSVAFSPNGYLLASGSTDRTVKLWDVSSGQCLRTLQGHSSGVWSVTFSPEGKTLASGGNDSSVKLWDVSSGQCLRTLQGHMSGIWSVTFSPEGKTLASGGNDSSVKLWDVSTGQCLRTLQGHTKCVRSVVFSPDGQTLASGSDDETIKLWDIKMGECLKTFRSEGPYKGMNITGTTGLTAAQKAMLKALGAVES